MPGVKNVWLALTLVVYDSSKKCYSTITNISLANPLSNNVNIF